VKSNHSMQAHLALIALLLFVPALVHAQVPEQQPFAEPRHAVAEQPDPTFRTTARVAFLHPLLLEQARQPAPFPEVLIGSAVGLAVGAALGAGAGYLVYQASGPPDADMFGGVFAVAVGAAVGGAIGSWAGARWANDYRGNPWVTAGAAALGVAGGIGLGILLGDATESTALGVAVAIPIAIALPALAEIATSR
jgi:hypothetical protein